jgi:hypothetical protein
VARGIIGDELRARAILSRLATPAVSAQDIARFRATYAPVLARRVVVSPAPSWLPSGNGVALATSAPEAVFSARTGQGVTVRTAEGVYSVKAIEDTTALGALAYAVARPAVVDALRMELRVGSYAAWTVRMQEAAESRLVCERDRMPELGVVDLSAYAPFLSLDEVEATAWLSSRS